MRRNECEYMGSGTRNPAAAHALRCINLTRARKGRSPVPHNYLCIHGTPDTRCIYNGFALRLLDIEEVSLLDSEEDF